MSADLETTAPSALPDLVRPSTVGGALGADHVTLPRLYRGEKQSNAFGDGLVPLGSIYIAQGANDPEPEVIAETKKGESTSEVVRAHFINVKLGLSRRVPGQPLQTWGFFDPAAHPDARVTYDYTLLLPDVDPSTPVKVLMGSTSTQTAKRINFQLLSLEDESRWPELGFDLSIKSRVKEDAGEKHQWYVWQAIGPVEEPNEAHVKAAQKVATMIGAVGDITPAAPPVDTSPEI
jgi:hypothetical protein